MTMRALLTLALSVSAAFAATLKEPPNCSPRPCTYTITCAAETCTASEWNEIQAAINDAQLGDTIRLQAGRVFQSPCSAPITIARKTAGSGYLTITSSGELPPVGARVTPHWVQNMPTIRTCSGGPPAIVVLGSTSGGAENVIISGIRFTGCYQPIIRLGGPFLQWASATDDAHQPNEIYLRHIIIENENWNSHTCGSMIQSNARTSYIQDSYLHGALWIGGEKQAISTFNGPGPLFVENNYLGDVNGENIMLGGTAPTYRNMGHSAVIRYNALVNHPERMRFSRWRPSMTVYKGRIIAPSSSSSPTFKALNSGTTGTTEPSWPSTIGAEVQDGQVRWRVVSTSNSHYSVKNNFELKNALRVTVQYNHLAGMWVDAQYENVVYKLVNCLSGSSSCGCVPYVSGTVNTSGTQVTSADGAPLPDFLTVRTNTITINGTQYTVADWTPGNPQTLVLSTSAGNQSNVPYSFGDANCRPGWLKHVTFENNWISGGPLGFQITAVNDALTYQIGDILVRGNLITDINPTKWSAVDGSLWNARAYTWIYDRPPATRFEANTIIGTNAPTAGFILGNAANSWAGTITRNIWPVASGAALQGFTPTTSESQSMLTSFLCQGSPCTEYNWHQNVMAGANLTRWSVGTHWNLCASSTGCTPPSNWTDPVHGPLFQSAQAGIWKTRHTHPGSIAGSRVEEVPLILAPDGAPGPAVHTSDTAAAFAYRTTPALSHIPCSLELSTTQDMDSRVTSISPAALHDSSNQSPPGQTPDARIILVRNLSPSTTYYYRLHCGAIHEGRFTTKATAGASSRPVSISFRPSVGGQYRLEWGTSYDRTTGNLLGGGSGLPVSCAAGQHCQVSAIAATGIVLARAVGPSPTSIAIIN